MADSAVFLKLQMKSKHNQSIALFILFLIYFVSSRYQKALASVGSRLYNAIVVDSLATVQQIEKNDAKFLNFPFANFIPLDNIRTESNLAHFHKNIDGLSSEICLLTDVVSPTEDTETIPDLTKAIHFVFGNIVWCPDDESASHVAYDLGNGKQYNAISEEGTFYHADGRISVEFAEDSIQDTFGSDDGELFYSKLSKLEAEFDEESRNLMAEKNAQDPSEIIRFVFVLCYFDTN